MSKRPFQKFRYILTGVAAGSDPISDFRLISANNMGHKYNGATALRVKIPADLKLEKLSCDSYSTTEDARTLDELGYDVLAYHHRRGKWLVMNELKGMNPCDMNVRNHPDFFNAELEPLYRTGRRS